jgi:hypothetical protein
MIKAVVVKRFQNMRDPAICRASIGGAVDFV